MEFLTLLGRAWMPTSLEYFSKNHHLVDITCLIFVRGNNIFSAVMKHIMSAEYSEP
jgi:hypothetical protein